MTNFEDKLIKQNESDSKMQKFQHKPGYGSLFQIHNKFKENYPDYTGKIILSKQYNAGDEAKLAGWKRQSTKGEFLSLTENTYETQVNLESTFRSNNE